MLWKVTPINFSKLEQFLDRHTPCFYKATTVLTHPDKDCLGDRKNIYVMPNPVTFTAAKELPQKEKVILAAGRLNDWKYKGWDILIKAWGSLQDSSIRMVVEDCKLQEKAQTKQ